MFKTVLCIAGLTVMAGLAFGDSDPALYNDGSSCPGPAFCGNSTEGECIPAPARLP